MIKDCSGEGSLGNWEYDEVANKKSPYVTTIQISERYWILILHVNSMS